MTFDEHCTNVNTPQPAPTCTSSFARLYHAYPSPIHHSASLALASKHQAFSAGLTCPEDTPLILDATPSLIVMPVFTVYMADRASPSLH
ncbi:unnamed protein product [Protopolystoma xenopodis]|uniref:Uncharacterized protein n=1 Tax=Protopolystoma xenopodis TaxID=117903 RepID=A0A448WHC9_9PLAT|nr:unnamed protein product [Protopolystoma xenopodis]